MPSPNDPAVRGSPHTNYTTLTVPRREDALMVFGANVGRTRSFSAGVLRTRKRKNASFNYSRADTHLALFSLGVEDDLQSWFHVRAKQFPFICDRGALNGTSSISIPGKGTSDSLQSLECGGRLRYFRCRISLLRS